MEANSVAGGAVGFARDSNRDGGGGVPRVSSMLGKKCDCECESPGQRVQ